MAEFSIKKIPIKGNVDELEWVAKELLMIQLQILEIKNNLGFEISAASNIRSRLNRLSEDVGAERKSMGQMSAGLGRVVQTYGNTEKRICGRTKAGNNIRELISQALSYVEGTKLENILVDLKDIQKFIFDLNCKNGNINDIKKLLLFGITTYEDITGLIGEMKEWLDDKKESFLDATSIEASAQVSWQYWGNGIEGQYGSAGVSVLAASAYASADAGLFTEDEDGNIIFNPRIDAQAGVSFTALHADGKAHVGNEMLGTQVNGSVDVGKVDASVGASVGAFNDKGEFDPRAKVDANVEAVLAEASAEGSITVLGTEAKVNGSVYAGFGARMNAGYEDGVLSFNIGAAIGIGASVGFEVDIGGTIDAIKDVAKSKFFSWLKG